MGPYLVNLTETQLNVGILVALLRGIVKDGRTYNVVRVSKPVLDVNDDIECELINEGRGFKITEPGLPGFIMQNIVETNQVLDNTGHLAPVVTSQEELALHLEAPHRTKKATVYNFPSGVVCTNKVFNVDRGTDVSLDADFQFLQYEPADPDGELVDFLNANEYLNCPLVTWHMIVKDSGKTTQREGKPISKFSKLRKVEEALGKMDLEEPPLTSSD